MKSFNLLMNFFSVIDSFLFSFHPKLNFHKLWNYFFRALIFASGIFILCDPIFTNWPFWSFNEPYITGIYFWELPLQKVLFFVYIPFSMNVNFNAFI